MHAHAALRERQRDAPGADAELQRAAAGERLEEVDDGGDGAMPVRLPVAVVPLRDAAREPIDHPDRFSLPCCFAYRSPTLNTASPIGIENAPITSSGQTSAHASPAPFRICSRLPRSA